MNDLTGSPRNASPFFFEGAFGTYYYKKLQSDEPCELGNLYHAGVVSGIHAEYIAAGVDAIKTNTFGANIFNFPDRDLLTAIIRRGYEIAESAVRGTPARLFADIGFIAADNETADVLAEYVFITEEFIRLGAACYIFETMSEYESIVPAIRLIRARMPEAFIVVSFAVMQDGYTGKGHYYKNLLAEAGANPDIDVCGLNCLCGPNHLYKLLQDLPPDARPLCAMPNSGYPSTVNGRTVFVDNIEYFSQKLKDIRGLGVDYLGGCCGTTPGHMKAAIETIGERFVPDTKAGIKEGGYSTNHFTKDYGYGKGRTPMDASADPAAAGIKVNAFLDKLQSGRKLLAVEIDPPADTDTAFIISAAAHAGIAGADIITIADSPLARSRADSIILAAKIRRETGIEVLPHMSCRDRNHIGIKASLLGAAIEGIRNILVITGDPVSSADKAETRGM
ncbi:MAG: homocysteine S-methyltransferase family protein, partial [Saccharofermentanales bacterium]